MKLINGLTADVYHKQWREANPARMKEYWRRSHKKRDRISFERLKNLVYSHYGPKCVCCGETTQEFLSLDHINNDGAAHRRKIGEGREVIYRWLIKNNFPSSFQVLCMNCQWGKRRRGICPHQAKVLTAVVFAG